MIEKKILGVKINFDLTMSDVVSRVEEMIKGGGQHVITTTNPEFILTAQNDEEFMKILNDSDLSLVDGSGVLFAYYYLKEVKEIKKDFLYPLRALVFGLKLGFRLMFNKDILKNKISGSDLFWELCSQSSNKGYSIFLLGGWPKNFLGKMKDVDYDLAKKVQDIVRNKYPDIKIIGGTSEFSGAPKDDQVTIEYINTCMKNYNISSLDMIFVAYGQRKQEKWLIRNMSKIPAKLGIGFGGTFDYVVGNPRRAPGFIRNLHLEWLYRLVMQPWRIRRIFMAFPVFPVKVYLHSIRK